MGSLTLHAWQYGALYMRNEPLATGPRLHSQAAVDRAVLADLLGPTPEDEPLIEEESTPQPQSPVATEPPVVTPLESLEAAEIAANAIISVYCQHLPDEPNMMLTGAIRSVIIDITKTLCGANPDFSAPRETLRMIDEAFIPQT